MEGKYNIAECEKNFGGLVLKDSFCVLLHQFSQQGFVSPSRKLLIL